MSEASQYFWYVVHVSSGQEKAVAKSIKDQAAKDNVSDMFEQIIVPVETVTEVKQKRQISKEKKILPGYIIVKMVMSDITWHLIKKIPKVYGFLDAGGKPKKMTEAEVSNIFKCMEEGALSSKSVVIYEIGESVKVIEGPFETFVGTVKEVDPEKSKLKVLVSIFGRATAIELEHSQVAKLN
ncbi:MAG: transcription termination/antitermination protein NusG [Rickettsiales endosymbiont of Dermacentor nuttalli]